MSLGTLVRHQHPARRAVLRGSNRLYTHTPNWDRLMDDLWSGFGLAPLELAPHGFAPVFDAVELESEYRVTGELPGVDADDLDVTVEDGVLSIKGQRRLGSENPADANEASAAAEHFERRIRFTGEVVESAAKARYKNGLLTVTIPKPEELKPEVRSIPVETA